MKNYQAGLTNPTHSKDSAPNYNANLNYNRSNNSYPQTMNSRGGVNNTRNERAKPYSRYDTTSTSSSSYNTNYSSNNSNSNRGSYKSNGRNGHDSNGYENTYSSYSTGNYGRSNGNEYRNNDDGGEYGRSSVGYGNRHNAETHLIKMRGLPFQASESDISSVSF